MPLLEGDEPNGGGPSDAAEGPRFLLRQLSDGGAMLLLPCAILVGSITGLASPAMRATAGNGVDWTILLLVSLLFFEVRLADMSAAVRHPAVILAALVCNFVVIPSLGYGIASLFMIGEPAALIGLVIYFTAPCTDWFLGFTRLAHGDTAAGAALLPINMLIQLVLYPVYLRLFGGAALGIDAGQITLTLLHWFLLPFVTATAFGHALRLWAPARLTASIFALVDRVLPLVIAVLVAEIFAANVATIVAHLAVFARVLGAVFIFFVATFWLGEIVARRLRLGYRQHALLTMTTAARNAPLMLGITAVALPNQPLVYAALIIGMLVEFPHLTTLTYLTLRRRKVALPPREEAAT